MTDANPPQSHSEQTDPAKLGETGARAERPGGGYPPDEPLGVDDPSILGDARIARDDVETRADRERPEMGDARDVDQGRVDQHPGTEEPS